MKITMLVGLPGSGKTTLGDQMVGDDPNAETVTADPNTIFLDDITVIGGIDELKEAIAFGWENIIVSDVFLCRPIDRDNAVRWLEKNAEGYEVEWIYFENAPDKCRANVRRRNAGGDPRKVGELINELTKFYVIPKGATVRTVFG